MPQLIHFFGPDGAGKSTQAALLIDYLQKRKMPAKMWWVRSPHTIAFLVWRLFVRIGFYRVIKNDFGIPIKLPAINSNNALRTFWSTVEFLGLLPLVLKTRFNLFFGKTLVAERFLLDSITTIAFFESDAGFVNSFFSRLILRFIPKDTLFIFLDSTYEAIFKRRAPLLRDVTRERDNKTRYGQLPEAAVEPKQFIEFQREICGKLSKAVSALHIDTSKCSIHETFEIILRCLNQ